MTHTEARKVIEELQQVMETMFWKGEKNHPKKLEFMEALTLALSAFERLSVEEIEKIIHREMEKVTPTHIPMIATAIHKAYEEKMK